MTVRPARFEDRELFIKWTIKNNSNEIDPGILKYRNTTIRVACGNDGEPIVFMPIQRPLHLESLAIKPGASRSEIKSALKVLLQDVLLSALAEGSGEIYFAASEDTIPRLALNHKDPTLPRFEELPYKVYRVKIYDKGARPKTQDARSDKQPDKEAGSGDNQGRPPRLEKAAGR